ncbi:hypothetical protein Droror1_Dr00015349 [Drosera rotundifolia]
MKTMNDIIGCEEVVSKANDLGIEKIDVFGYIIDNDVPRSQVETEHVVDEGDSDDEAGFVEFEGESVLRRVLECYKDTYVFLVIDIHRFTVSKSVFTIIISSVMRYFECRPFVVSKG